MKKRPGRVLQLLALLLAPDPVAGLALPRSFDKLPDYSHLLALHKNQLSPSPFTVVMLGAVATDESAGCAKNPVLYVLSRGMEEAAVAGELLLTRKGREMGTVVIGAPLSALQPPPASSAKSSEVKSKVERLVDQARDSWPDADRFLVFDVLRMGQDGFISDRSEWTKLFTIARNGRTLRLRPKTLQYYACPLSAVTPSRDLVDIVSDLAEGSHPWLMLLGSSEVVRKGITRGAAQADAKASAHLKRVAATGGAMLVLPRAVKAPSAAWRGTYTIKRRRWDRCSPTKRASFELVCSGGATFWIRTLWIMAESQTFQDLDWNQNVRLRLKSVPAADIYFGPIRHTAGSGSEIDVRPRDLRGIRFEKAGYESCPYGPRWQAVVLDPVRQLVEVTCVMRREGRSTRRTKK